MTEQPGQSCGGLVRRTDGEREAYVQGYVAGVKFVLTYWKTGSTEERERVVSVMESLRDYPWQARLERVEVENTRLREALFECAKVSGADISAGVPTWPSIDVWAVECVQEMRDIYDQDDGS